MTAETKDDYGLMDSRVLTGTAESADVIVIGGGSAGLSAAIAAREAGAEVLVLERGSGLSGTTTLAGGMLYLGGGTPVQKANGFEDTPQATVERYNGFAETGEDADFHKHADWLAPIATAPFAAFQCSVGESYYVGFTLGGLDVSVDAEVLRENGEPIPGLYAAGAGASNIAQDGAGYSSGTCIGEATFFGRRGGRHAAGRV